jgi:hypothetical protein
MATIKSSGHLNIGYKGKMFAQPECKYELEHVLPNGESELEGKMIVEAFKKLFTEGFKKLQKERESAIKKAMDDTEKAINKKPPANMEAFLATANKLIQQGVDVWRQVEIPRLAEECISKVYDFIEKKLKKKMNREKAKTVLKIIALVLIVLAVGAAAIAATVLTGGALAPIVLAAIGTGIGALVSSGKIIKKEYDAYQGYLVKIQKDVTDLQAAMDYQIKKKTAAEWRKLGPKEKVKLAIGGCGPIAKRLRGHLDDAEGRLLLMRKHMNEAIVTANDMEAKYKELSESNKPELNAEAQKAYVQMREAKRALEKMEEKKKAFDDLKSKATQQLAELEKNGEWNGGNVSKLAEFAAKHADTVNFFVDAIKSLVTSLGKIKKAVG